MKLSFSDEVCFGLAQARCERIHINYFRIPRTTVNEDMENNDGIPEPKKHITISPRLYCQIETFSRSQALSLNLTLLSIRKFQTSLLFPTSLFLPNFLSPYPPPHLTTSSPQSRPSSSDYFPNLSINLPTYQANQNQSPTSPPLPLLPHLCPTNKTP